MRSGTGAAAGARRAGRAPAGPGRSRSAAGALTVALLSGLVVLSSCAGDTGAGTPRPPTVPSIDFTAKLVLEVDDGGFRWRRGDRADPAVTVDPAAVPYGTVIEVVNTGTREHWVGAGRAFDTGRLQPGDTTTVAFTSDTLATVGAAPQTYQIVDRDDPSHTTTIVVTPKPDPA
jgi:hypothetical protein